MPTDTEFSNMEALVEAIQPIAEITDVMGKEKSVSFSAVQLFLHKLLNIHLIEQPTDSNVIKGIKQIVKRIIILTHKLCCYLIRPASWTLVLGRYHFCHKKIGQVFSFLLQKKQHQEWLQVPRQKHAQMGWAFKESKFLELSDNVMNQFTRDISPTDAAQKEIQKYLCIDAE